MTSAVLRTGMNTLFFQNLPRLIVINSDLFVSGHQFRRLDRYNVLRARCALVLGLDILRSSNCGK